MPKSRGGEGIREGFKGCFRFGHAVGGQAIRVSVFSFSPCTAVDRSVFEVFTGRIRGFHMNGRCRAFEDLSNEYLSLIFR